MRSLSDTLARLKRLSTVHPDVPSSSSRLRALRAFGPNPGDLDAWIYVPENVAARPALVVVLHGCTQTAAGYDESSGWSRLAERHGFVVLYPEQRRANNPNLCFNWFLAKDAARGHREALSIREMIATVHERSGTDLQRVFVTGLSAGGAMAAVMLATYPNVFAGGAVIAGLPFGVADSVPQAFDRMRGHGGPIGSELAGLVRAASDYSGNWPILSVWHGTDDRIVDPSNASALIEQWRTLHGTAERPDRTDRVHGYPHRVWCDPNGRTVVEEYSITGFGHGTPLATSNSAHGEKSAPFMVDAGISSTHLISRFWDIVPDDERQVQKDPSTSSTELMSRLTTHHAKRSSGPRVGQVIDDALRAAGLIR
jgi:poly(hydroxyalkanoate) depolymerase family esterase